MIDFQKALDNVGMTYNNLVEISDDITSKYVKDLDELVHTLENIETLDNEAIRVSIMKLAFKSYSLGEAKEHSALKSECAETLARESQAKTFNEATGTVDVKKNTAFLEASNEILVNLVYNQVADQLARRLDECHRLIDAMKNILISRASEAKLNNIGMTEGDMQ